MSTASAPMRCAASSGKVPVYMGIGVDAPRVLADQAKCTPDIVYRSVLATYRAGGKGVIFAPNYAEHAPQQPGRRRAGAARIGDQCRRVVACEWLP